MNRYSQDSGTHGQQIVQAYAAKKAAQMERAKQIRLERERAKQNGGAQSPSTATAYPSAPHSTAHAGPPSQMSHAPAHAAPQHTTPAYDDTPAGGNVAPVAQGYSHAAYAANDYGMQYGAHPARPERTQLPQRAEPKHQVHEPAAPSVTSVLVGEADLTKAVQAGIITQDQCRKLWETFQRFGRPAEPHHIAATKENTVPLTKPNAQYNPMAAKTAYGQPQPLPRGHVQEAPQQAGYGHEERYDNLVDQGRMQSQLMEAKQRSTVVKQQPKGGGWNAETEINYDDPEPDDVFLSKQRQDKLPRKTSLQKRALPDWNSNVEEDSAPAGFGEPPKLPNRKAAKKPAARATPRSGAEERVTPRTGKAGGMGGGIGASRTPAAQQYNAYDDFGGPGAPPSAYRGQPQAQQPSYDEPAYGAPGQAMQDAGGMDGVEDTGMGGKSIAELEREAAEAAAEPQGQCHTCGRTFRQSVLNRHAKTCGKTRQRRVFDASKQRELPDQNMVLKTRDPAPSSQKANWKQQHEQFQQAMKNNKLVAQVEKGALPASALQSLPPPPDNRVPCPHCTRKFAPDVADRHIPKCKNIKAKPKPTRRF